MPGLFITFEGLDGSGKSTHLRRAAARLEGRDLEVLTTHEPGGSELGDAIRGIFLDQRFDGMDGVVELLLVSASRRQHLIEVIEPALAAGRIVLCDRFADSTWAYQGAARGLDRETLSLTERVATQGRLPDLTLLFDLPAEEARRRGRSPSRREGKVDRLDREELDFYERVREGFLQRASLFRGRFRVVDSSRSHAETARQVREILDPFVGSRVSP